MPMATNVFQRPDTDSIAQTKHTVYTPMAAAPVKIKDKLLIYMRIL